MIAGAADKGADLAVLSESAIRCYSYNNPALREGMRRLSEAKGIDILYGAASGGYVKGERRFYNSAILVRSGKKTDDLYHKVHLVPFGEYVPFKDILSFVKKFSRVGIGDFTPGEAGKLVKMSDGTPFGIGICYEILFPELMSEFTVKGARFLATITNDTWYGDTAMPYQHFNLAVFRAIENRKYIVRVANSGYSGVITPDGQIIEKSALFQQVTIEEKIYLNDIKTIYVRFGNWFVYLNLIITALFIAWSIWRRKRGRFGNMD